MAELSFTTVKDYDDWIARLHAIPEAFDQVTANMEIGMDDHRVPPKYLLEKALEQVKQLADQKPEDSPLALPLKKFPASIPAAEQERIRTEMLDAIARKVLPAYQRFARFMEVSYIPAGRKDPGIWALPDGAKYYAFLIQRTTTTDLTARPDSPDRAGRGGEGRGRDAGHRAEAGLQGPEELPRQPEDQSQAASGVGGALLEAYRGYLAPMEAKLPQLFGTLPKAPLEVVAVPEYHGEDLSRRLTTRQARRMAAGRAVVYRHLRRQGPEPVRRGGDRVSRGDSGASSADLDCAGADRRAGTSASTKHYTAYTEGWALYAERLGKDIGFYQDPYSDYGRLEGDIWRAIRLVVDTGVHSQHWTRQQMVDYFHEHSTM